MRGKNKKKLKFGDYLVENQSALGQGFGLAGQTVDSLLPETSTGGGIASGALKGAGQGAAFGPWGMAAGAAIGGTLGAINAKKAKETEKSQLLQQQYVTNRNLMNNAGNAFKEGGKMSSKLNVVKGGSLDNISNDAVEVNANNPNQDDSVELANAYVDHNEVIDNKNRVFSDSVFLPNGKSIAKEAKKLEKMKSKTKRFDKANSLVDSKIDALFNYQEKSKAKQAMKKGGKLKMLGGGVVDPTDPKELIGKVTNKPYKDPMEYTRQQYQTGVDIPANVASFFKSNNKAAKVILGTTLDGGNEWPGQVVDYDEGIIKQGLNPVGDKANYDKTGQLPVKTTLKKGGKIKLDHGGDLFEDPLKNQLARIQAGSVNQMNMASKNITKGLKKEKGFPELNLGQGDLTAAATYAPNLVNSFLQKRLKGPAAPALETITRLKRVSPNAQLTEVAGDYSKALDTVTKNTGQGSVVGSNVGNLLAKKLAANNQMFGQNNQLNANINNQEALMNQQIKGRNTERLNQFNQNINDFSNKKLELKSDNVANLSSKILAQGREKNQMQLDRERFDIIKSQFGDSGVLTRVMAENPQIDWDKFLTKPKNKMGGKLGKASSKKKK